MTSAWCSSSWPTGYITCARSNTWSPIADTRSPKRRWRFTLPLRIGWAWEKFAENWSTTGFGFCYRLGYEGVEKWVNAGRREGETCLANMQQIIGDKLKEAGLQARVES